MEARGEPTSHHRVEKAMLRRMSSRSIHGPVLSRRQLWLQDVLASAGLRAMLAVVILANLICTVVQTDRDSAGEEPLLGITIFDFVVLGIFTVEFVCKVCGGDVLEKAKHGRKNNMTRK